MKSYAEAHLKHIATNGMIAFVIWEVGVPKLTPAAEQRDSHSQQGAVAAEQRTDALEADTIAILAWIRGAAECIIAYKNTDNHKEAQRRAGTKHGVSGITPEERAREPSSEVRNPTCGKGSAWPTTGANAL